MSRHWTSLLGCLLLAAAPVVADEPAKEEPPEEQDQAIDKVRSAVHKTVAVPAAWFDRLFGDARAFEEADRTYGLVRLGAEWDEYDGTDGVARLRAKLFLPAMERRLSAVFGRLSDERLITEETGPETLPADFDDEDEEWLLGLDYARVRGTGSRFNIGVGLRLSTPVEPYVKVRYRFWHALTRRSGFRYRLTPYWQDGKRQAGVRTSVDLDYRAATNLLLRWSVTGTQDNSTRGSHYAVSSVLYHRIDDRHAMAHRVGMLGETHAEVEPEKYGFLSSLRRRLHREWLFVQAGAGVEWRRERLDEPRRAGVVLELLAELQFGERR